MKYKINNVTWFINLEEEKKKVERKLNITPESFKKINK